METDDLLAAHGAIEASHLRAQTFTAQDLINIAHERGYTFLNSGQLWVWVHRGWFPAAREHLKAKGQPGIWRREDVVRLLDLCSLLAANSRGDAAHLGLWLLGYETNAQEPPSIRKLLTEQIARMERALYGQVLDPVNDAGYDEAALDALAVPIGRAVDEASDLDDLCSGLRLWLHDADLDDFQQMHPDGYAGASRSELEHATLPAGTRQAERLQQLLKHNVLWDVPGERALQSIHDALSAVVIPPASRVTPEQRAKVQHTILAAMLWALADQLPAFRRTLHDAPDGELRQARLLTEHLMLHTFGWQRVFPAPRLTGLKRIAEEYRWDQRRLFAAPAFFPLTAYLIAALVYSAKHSKPPIVGDQIVSPPSPVIIRRDLLSVALDQLARLTRESTSRAEAFLAVVFSAVPTGREEVSG